MVRRQSDAVWWREPAELPDEGVVLVGDAGALSPEDVEEPTAWLESGGDRRLRFAACDVDAVAAPWRTSAAPAALSEAETFALLGQFESLADPRLVHVPTRGVLAAVVLVGRHGAVSAADIIDALSRGDAVAGPLAELAALEHVPRVMLDELDLLDEAHRLIRSGLAEWNLGRRAMRWSPIARWSTLQG